MAIEGIIQGLNKKFKKDIIMKGTELKSFKLLPFSSPQMNYLTRGGIAEGKMTMLVGKESCGKTTSALDLLANFQKKYPERYAVYLDAENTLDKDWGETLGVDWDKVILIKPEEEYGETLLDMVLDCIRSGEVGLVIVDSVPFIVPKAQYEEDLEKKAYGGNSALMRDWCDKIIPLMNKHNCTTIVINQVRDMMGVTYTAYNYPGGRMLKHSCSSIIFFSKGSLLDEKGKEVSNGYESPQGHIINAKIEKNKITKNDRRLGSYTLNYTIGVDILTDTIEVALKVGLLKQGGAWFYADINGEEVKFQGKANLVDYFKEHQEDFDRLYKSVHELIA